MRDIDEKNIVTAVLISSQPPSEDQEKRFVGFLESKYGCGVKLVWKESHDCPHGFKLSVGSDLYDWTVEGRLEQMKHELEHIAQSDNIIPLIKKTADDWIPAVYANSVGTVRTIGDGIAVIEGLNEVGYGEILVFESGIRGMVQNINTNEAGCILFDDDDSVVEGSLVYRTGKTAGVPVGDGFIGRVIDALGRPIDGKGEIKSDLNYAIEHSAPGIVDRAPVDKPLETGILAIDAMFPIGKGQRELIIGDRQTGKTAIAIDTIVNQKPEQQIDEAVESLKALFLPQARNPHESDEIKRRLDS